MLWETSYESQCGCQPGGQKGGDVQIYKFLHFPGLQPIRHLQCFKATKLTFSFFGRLQNKRGLSNYLTEYNILPCPQSYCL